jgi:hypothetical protein
MFFDPMAGFAGVVRNARRVAVRLIAASASAFLLSFAGAQAEQPFVTINGDLKTTAWWVIAEFHPFTTEVRGIPVNQIRKNWCKATEFRKDWIPKELLIENNVDGMAQAGLSFALEGRFDGSAANQVALVGVYQECAGKTGGFVLIVDQLADGKSKVRFLSASPTERQFSVLGKGEGNSIIVRDCMDCDNRAILKWDQKKRKFDWLPGPTED